MTKSYSVVSLDWIYLRNWANLLRAQTGRSAGTGVLRLNSTLIRHQVSLKNNCFEKKQLKGYENKYYFMFRTIRDYWWYAFG